MNKIIIVIVLLLFPSLLFSETYHLFEFDKIEGVRQVKDYNAIILKLKKGDVLIFKEKDRVVSFTIDSLIGEGNTTKIFSLLGDPQKALRIPAASGIFKLPNKSKGDLYTSFITKYLDGFNGLSENDVPMLQIYKAQSMIDQFVLVEKLSTHITFEDFLFNNKTFTNHELYSEMLKGLSDFSKQVAHLSVIGDFHSQQLVYVFEKKKWLLIDWTRGIKTIKFQTNSSFRAQKHIFLDLTKTVGQIPIKSIDAFLFSPKTDMRASAIVSFVQKTIQDKREQLLLQQINGGSSSSNEGCLKDISRIIITQATKK